MIKRILRAMLLLVLIRLSFLQNNTNALDVNPGLGENISENLTGDSVDSDVESILNEPPPLSENETVGNGLDECYIEIDLLNQSGQEFNGTAIVTSVIAVLNVSLAEEPKEEKGERINRSIIRKIPWFSRTL